MGINELLRNNGKNISGGQLKRIALARAIYASRDILLLDEVTNGLDLNTKTKILLNLMKSEKTVILISHDEDIKHYFNNIIDFNEIHKG
jgi:ATP-binding cassette subfamily B protein